jgi:hypothetical protein
MNAPFGIESSEKWFIELWNYTILPYLNDIVKMKLILSENGNSLSVKQTDPVEWLVNNYPWPKSATATASNCVPSIGQRLFRLKLYDNYLTNSARSSSSDESDLHQQQQQQHTVVENNGVHTSHHHLVRKRLFSFLI